MDIGRLVIDHRHHRLRHRHLRSPLLPPLRERTISPSTTKQKPSQNPKKTVITRKDLETLKPRVGWSCEGFNCFCSNHPIYCFLIIHNTKAFENSGIELCWSWICWQWNTVVLLVFCIHDRHICSCNDGCPRNCSSWIPLLECGMCVQTVSSRWDAKQIQRYGLLLEIVVWSCLVLVVKCNFLLEMCYQPDRIWCVKNSSFIHIQKNKVIESITMDDLNNATLKFSLFKGIVANCELDFLFG